jgi:hypothetical protein
MERAVGEAVLDRPKPAKRKSAAIARKPPAHVYHSENPHRLSLLRGDRRFPLDAERKIYELFASHKITFFRGVYESEAGEERTFCASPELSIMVDEEAAGVGVDNIITSLENDYKHYTLNPPTHPQMIALVNRLRVTYSACNDNPNEFRKCVAALLDSKG